MKSLLENDSWTIVDGNFMVKRCVYSGQDKRLVNSKQLFTGGTYKFLKSLWSIKEKGTLTCVFDGGHSHYRKQIYPEYKVKPPREPDPAKIQSELDTKTTFSILGDLLPNMDIPTIRMMGEEADDVIFVIARHLASLGKTVYVVTDDSDYLQFVNYGIRVWQPMKERLITKDNFEEIIGYKSEFFTLFKAINGDSSDGIGGVPGVGDKTLIKIVNQLADPSIQTLLTFLETQKDKRSQAIRDNLKIIKRNLLLVDLKHVQLDTKQVIDIFHTAVGKCTPEPKYIYDAFQDLEFGSLLNWVGHLANLEAHYNMKGVRE